MSEDELADEAERIEQGERDNDIPTCESCKVRVAYEPEGVVTSPKLCMNCMYDLDDE